MTFDGLVNKLGQAERDYNKAIKRAYKRTAIQMVSTSRGKHLSGPRMPRGVGGGFDGSTLASKTGMIMRVHYVISESGGEIVGRVGTNLTNRGYAYPRAHEYGLDKMPERPWLRPAVAAHQQDLVDEIRNEVTALYE